MNKRLSQTLAAASSVVIGITGISVVDRVIAQEELTDVKFSLSWALQGVDAPLLVAMNEGYFEEEGLNVTFDRGFGSADAVTKIAAGQYDIGFGDINSMMEFNSKNDEVKMTGLYMLYNKLPMGLCTLREYGLESPDQLPGKRLGAPAGSATRKFFPVFASLAGVDPESVEWISVEPKLQQTVLIQGQVDAAAGFASSCLPALRQVGFTEEDWLFLFYNDYGLELYGNTVMARQSTIDEDPEMVEAFLRGFNRGMIETLRDPEAAIDVMVEMEPLLDKDVELDRLQIAINTLWITPEIEAVGLGGIDPGRMEDAIAQVVDGFSLESEPEVEEVFIDDFLPPMEDRQIP